MKYKIIIPKTKDRIFSETSEETKQECFVTKCMHLDAEIAYKSLLKQETLEEFKKRFANDKSNKDIKLDYQDGIYYGIEVGAKWQQERMYSEEDMREAIQETITLMRYKATEFREHENTVIEQFKK